MINWKKHGVCDACDAIYLEPRDVYTITFQNSGKKIKLCPQCFKDLRDEANRLLEEVLICHDREGR